MRGASDVGSGEEPSKRREQVWLAPKTGRRSTRVGEEYQVAVLPNLGEREREVEAEGSPSAAASGGASAVDASLREDA